MHDADGSIQQHTPTKPHRFWTGRIRFIALAVFALALAIIWLTGIMDHLLNQWADLPNEQSAAFEITTYPRINPPPNAGPLLRCKCWYQTLKVTWGLRFRNPSQIKSLPQPVQQWPISYLLHQCMWNSGTRYMIAKELAGQTVSFGTTNTLDGAQWAAAAEDALRKKGLILIRVRPKLVLVIPEGKLDQYRKAGLVKTGDLDSGR